MCVGNAVRPSLIDRISFDFPRHRSWHVPLCVTVKHKYRRFVFRLTVFISNMRAPQSEVCLCIRDVCGIRNSPFDVFITCFRCSDKWRMLTCSAYSQLHIDYDELVANMHLVFQRCSWLLSAGRVRIKYIRIGLRKDERFKVRLYRTLKGCMCTICGRSYL